MDVQKEREAFKQHLTDTGLVEFAGYGFAVDECDEYLHEPTQVAWDSWLIGLNRAKAQAVPEGFVLVEKAKLMQIIGSVSLIEPITRGNPYMDSVKRELTAITDVVKTVIEAQEQSHE